MSDAAASRPSAADTAVGRRQPNKHAGIDPVVAALLLAGLALLYLPSYASLARVVWPTDEQGHGPIILAVTLWLMWRCRHQVVDAVAEPWPWLGAAILVPGLLVYVLGRSQSILMLEVGSHIVVLVSVILMFLGVKSLRVLWFPLVFMLFMVPLPEVVVASITGPLKSAVSAVAATLLYSLGYPVGHAGVVLTVGQYQLLVADVCAGLTSMFTLEALGLLYMNLMRYADVLRNVIMAILIVPIAFIANVVRVSFLVLITYHLGDEAGQGFTHSLAGVVLFIAGLLLMLATDAVLGVALRSRAPHP